MEWRLSPVLVSGHALLVHGPWQLLGVREDVVVVQNDRLDDLVDMRLTGHLVQRVGCGEQGGAKHDGQVPGIHHVLVAVLGKTAGGHFSVETFEGRVASAQHLLLLTEHAASLLFATQVKSAD